MTDKNDFGEFDFGGDVPPDTADGVYTVRLDKVMAKPAVEGKGRVIALECQIVEGGAQDQENNAQYEGKKVTSYFMPKEANHKYFSAFVREVKEMALAFDAAPPKVERAAMATPEAWEPWLSSLKGQTAVITLKNETGKDGRSFPRVRFGVPKTLNLSRQSDEE